MIEVYRCNKDWNDIWAEKEQGWIAYSLLDEEDGHEELKHVWVDPRRERLLIEDVFLVQKAYTRSPKFLELLSQPKYKRLQGDWDAIDNDKANQAQSDSKGEFRSHSASRRGWNPGNAGWWQCSIGEQAGQDWSEGGWQANAS